MRLSELNPRWVMPLRFSVQLPTGISFDCPCCRSRRLSVAFRNPIDPERLLAATAWRASEPAWDRSGETFENLTLLPSIDFSGTGHWHGHITAGEITTS